MPLNYPCFELCTSIGSRRTLIRLASKTTIAPVVRSASTASKLVRRMLVKLTALRFGM